MYPAHAITARLRPRHLERRERRVYTGDLEASLSQEERERARPTTDVQHAPSAKLSSNTQIHIEVAAVSVERVIDCSEPWMLEDVVSHTRATISLTQLVCRRFGSIGCH